VDVRIGVIHIPKELSVEMPDDTDREDSGPQGNWLEQTRKELVSLPSHPFDDPGVSLPLWKRPWLWTVVVLGVLSWLNLVVLW